MVDPGTGVNCDTRHVNLMVTWVFTVSYLPEASQNAKSLLFYMYTASFFFSRTNFGKSKVVENTHPTSLSKN